MSNGSRDLDSTAQIADDQSINDQIKDNFIRKLIQIKQQNKRRIKNKKDTNQNINNTLELHQNYKQIKLVNSNSKELIITKN